MSKDVYIVDGSRTPFLKAGGKPNPLTASDLAVAAAKPLLERQPFAANEVGEVILGCVGPGASETNIGRILALRAGCGDKVPGYTVQRNCASGLQAIDSGFRDISAGLYDIVLAGGTDAMSRAPFLFNEGFVNWFAGFYAAKTLHEKLFALLKFRPRYLVPEFALLKALNDPVVNLSMGQTAEKLAFQFGITRTEMDEFSVRSHQRVLAGMLAGNFKDELAPLFDWRGKFYEGDNGVRTDSNLEKLATLKPAFDKPFGLVTAGNSSQISDGAAVVLLASQAAIDKYKLKPLARIVDVSWQALDPAIMGLGPALVIAQLILRNKLTLDKIDFIEINEAFACQVLACVRALEDPAYCKENFGIDKPIGTINQDKLNVDGGAIAIGHPVGATGARLTYHMVQTLIKNKAKLGISSMCIGGGQGGGILLENVAEDK
jgi:acetyl-CoA C-acetyltransferase